jgi:peptide/nickel transport system substrate-binding protein
MSRFRVHLLVSLLVLIALAAAACGPTPAPVAPTEAPTQAAVATATEVAAPAATEVPVVEEKITLVVVDGTEPSCGLYPPTCTGPPGHLTYLTYDPLVGHDERMAPDPDLGLATSWEVGEDQLTWTFHLREGVKFHDGTPFDANAVKVTIESILDPDVGALRRSVYTVIKEVNVVDPLTVQFVTDGPFPDLPFLLTDRSAFIVSPTALQKMGVADFARQPVGTGPFKFVEWVPNDHITYEANPDYWRGKPAVDLVIYRPVPEAAVRTAMLRTGEADIAVNISPEDLESLGADPNIVVIQKDSLTQVTSEMRQTKPPFSIKEVRKAMNYAVDKESIVNDIMHGAGRIADSPGPPNVWGSVALEPYNYDPEKAKQLLADAGYPNGFEGNLFYVSGRWAGDEQVTQALQAYWQAVGVQISLNKVDQAGLDTMLKKHPDDMAGWTTQQIRTSSYLDYHLYRLFNCEAAIMEAAQRSGYCNPAVDELLAKGRATFDLDERLPYYAEAQELIWDDAPFVWVFVQQNLMAARKDVSGYIFLPTGNLILYGTTK